MLRVRLILGGLRCGNLLDIFPVWNVVILVEEGVVVPGIDSCYGRKYKHRVNCRTASVILLMSRRLCSVWDLSGSCKFKGNVGSYCASMNSNFFIRWKIWSRSVCV